MSSLCLSRRVSLEAGSNILLWNLFWSWYLFMLLVQGEKAQCLLQKTDLNRFFWEDKRKHHMAAEAAVCAGLLSKWPSFCTAALILTPSVVALKYHRAECINWQESFCPFWGSLRTETLLSAATAQPSKTRLCAMHMDKPGHGLLVLPTEAAKCGQKLVELGVAPFFN